jgi:hypothetical protein
LFLVTINRKPSASKQHRELTSWLLPSEREQRRPLTEQNEFGRNPRMGTVSDESDIFGNRRRMTTTATDERQPISYYTTSYGQHYNQIAQFREQTNTSTTHSASYMPRTYSQVFNENK